MCLKCFGLGLLQTQTDCDPQGHGHDAAPEIAATNATNEDFQLGFSIRNNEVLAYTPVPESSHVEKQSLL